MEDPQSLLIYRLMFTIESLAISLDRGEGRRRSRSLNSEPYDYWVALEAPTPQRI